MGCGCGKSSCSSCGSIEIGSSCCGNVSPATPLQVSCNTTACAEDHCQTYISQQFYATLKVANSFNMPVCGGSAVLYVAGIKAIATGANLWADGIGYLEVVGFNADSQQITVQNNCADGNAPEGTQIPACTEFTVTDPPLAPGDSNQPALFPYVAVDFTAPNNGDCLLITVTTVNGLVVGKNVQVSSGTYRISAISDSTHITICNDGSGVTPGTAVIAKNAANQYQYPIILIDSNPCTNPTVTSGSLLVCADDISQPLTGPTEGSVPVLIDADTGEVEFQFFPGQSRTCASVLCCLTVVNGFAGPYVITVSDSSEFVVGDLLQIGSRTDRFTVTAVVDATHIQATVSPVPGATTDIDVGTSICIADCCEILQIEIDNLAGVTVEDGIAADLGVIDSGTPSATIGPLTTSITNPSTTNSMAVLVFTNFIAGGSSNDANTNRLDAETTLQQSIGVNPVVDIQTIGNGIFSFSDANIPYSFPSNFYMSTHIVAPGDTLDYNVAGRVTRTAGSTGTSSFDVTNAVIGTRMIGIAV